MPEGAPDAAHEDIAFAADVAISVRDEAICDHWKRVKDDPVHELEIIDMPAQSAADTRWLNCLGRVVVEPPSAHRLAL